MKNLTKSLKGKLIVWYTGSILLIAVYFWFGVHILSIPYGSEIFIALLILLSFVGFLLIKKITESLSALTKKVRTISSTNLNERLTVEDPDNEIGQLALSFNELLNRLEDSFSRERQFIGDVAHELKTPLANMKTGIEVVLSKDRASNEYKERLAECLVDINDLSTTLTEVLDLAWTEAHINQKLTKKVNFSKSLLELSEIATNLGMTKSIEVNFKITPNIWIYGERQKLSRAILNIIDNGIKYNKTEGTLSVTLTKKEEMCVLQISDSGVGIHREDIKSIFGRFYRGKNTGKASGSGLGLAIAKSIILLHGGQIAVKSTLNKGTTFTISLPNAL